MDVGDVIAILQNWLSMKRIKMKPVHVVLNKNKCSDPDQFEAIFSPGSELVQFE